MTRLLRRWFALPFSEQRQLLKLGLLLPIIAGLLRVLGIVRCMRLLQHTVASRSTHPASPEELQRAQRLAELAVIAGRRGALRTTCLRQALLIQWLLRRRGLAAELRVGVRKEDSLLDAHAWVDLDGFALGQNALAHTSFSKHDLLASLRE